MRDDNLYINPEEPFSSLKADILNIPGIKHVMKGYINENIKLKIESFKS